MAATAGTMRIADVTEFFSERGGVRRHLVAKGAALVEGGHQHLVIAPGARDEEGPLPGVSGGAVHRPGASTLSLVAGPRLPYDRAYRLLWRLGRVRARLERFRPDVVEIHSLYLAAILLRTLPRRIAPRQGIFWHSDFIDAYVVNHARAWLGRAAADGVGAPLWSWVRAVGRHADVVFVASRQQAEKLTARGVPGVRCVPFGFDQALFSPACADPAWRREALGGRSERPIVLGVGRLAGEKRFDVVLDAFFALRRKREALLVIFGDGPERQRLERRCAGRDDVRFAGFEGDHQRLARAMASADLLLHGAPFETFGMTLAQSLLSGLPMAVPDRGAAPELADPSCAEIYPAGDAAALAAAACRLLSRDRDELRAAARARGMRLPSPREHVDLSLSIWAGVAPRP